MDTDQKVFKCDIWENKFSRISSLSRHKRLHRGVKSLNCNIYQKTLA